MAWIIATRSPWRYTRSGNIIGKLTHPINPVSSRDSAVVPTKSIQSKIVPDVIFPKSLKAREITFANNPIISRNPRKREIIISPNFAITISG